MKQTIEERAESYASDCGLSGRDALFAMNDYIAGAKEEHILLTEWHDIETDKFGFATDAAMSKLWEERPVIIRDIIGNSFCILEEMWQFADLSNDLETKPHNFKWRKLYID